MRVLNAPIRPGNRPYPMIDTGHGGGFAFTEWTRSHGRVLLKTGLGPFLTGDPWNRTGWLNTMGREAA